MTAYCHIPGLGLKKGVQVSVCNGELRRFKFEEFEQLDRDWARETYFPKESSVFCVSNYNEKNDVVSPLDTSKLIRLIASAISKTPLPGPELSMRYGLGATRTIGVFHRTFLLNKSSIRTKFDQTEIDQCATLTNQAVEREYFYDHPIFKPIDAFGSIYPALMGIPAIRMMPTMVAFESIFAPERGPSFRDQIRTSFTIIDAYSEEIDEISKYLYKIRSDVIHGREANFEDQEFQSKLGYLVGMATLKLFAFLTKNQISAEEWHKWRSK